MIRKPEQAIHYFDRLIEEHPEFGRDTGRIVNVLLERVYAHGLEITDKRLVAMLQEIWGDKQYDSYLEVINVGRTIVAFANIRGDYKTVIDTGWEVLEAVDTRWPELSEDDIRKYGIDEAYAQVVITMCDHLKATGDILTPIALCTRLLKRFPESIFSEECQKTLDRLYRDKLLYHSDDYIPVIDDLMEDVNPKESLANLGKAMTPASTSENRSGSIAMDASGDVRQSDMDSIEKSYWWYGIGVIVILLVGCGIGLRAYHNR